jgi:protein-tyrosine phosphatase
MQYITDRLLVGTIEDAREPPKLIGGLLLVAEELTVAGPKGVPYAQVPLKEFGEASAPLLYRAVEWLERHVGDQPLLVCCRAGIGRSVSVILAYLCCVEGKPYIEALNLVKARRPGAMPLPGLEQTIEVVKRLRRSAAESRQAPQPSRTAFTAGFKRKAS